MKSIISIFSIVLFLFSNSVHAQDSVFREIKTKSNYFKVEFSGIGASLNMERNSTNPNANLLSNSSDVGIATTLVRFTHLFSEQFGWYAGINMNLFKEQKSPYYNSSFGDFIGELGLHAFYGGFTPKPMVEAGFVYRIEHNRWDIHPRIGFGYGNLLIDRDSDKKQKLTDGTIERAIYKQRSASSTVNFGVGTHYFFSKKSFIALNIALQQPLSKSYAELTKSINDVQTEYKKYSSSSSGRDLSLTVGYGFIIGKRKVSY